MPDGQDHVFTDYSNHPLRDLQIDLTICVGHARPRLKDVIGLKDGDILTLDKQTTDLVEVFVGDKLIARGELIETGEEGELGVRITDVLSGSAPF
ncbi:MAG: FliM/FliN family flagellar motor switch protein [Marivivens sp.]|nr:FliM/FliN family flagellar motor switch protein [Marivivens sp.]